MAGKLRMLCQIYLKLDDELVAIAHEIEQHKGTAREKEAHFKYVKKYIQLEDFKSGMRRHLVNELLNGVGCDDYKR